MIIPNRGNLQSVGDLQMPQVAPESMGSSMADYLETSACPSCGAAQGEIIFREQCEDVEIAIVVCAECGMGYSNPRPTEAFKLRRYQEWAGQLRPWKAEAHYDHRQQLRHFHLYRRVMELVQGRVPKGRLLDVGCAGGLFLIFAGVYASADNAGINSAYEVEGVGFDPNEVQLSHQISGAPVRSLAELRQVSAGFYDAITVLNVLEHVNQPLDLLCQLRRVLQPSGTLVIVVPNNFLAFWKLHCGISHQTSFAASEHINHFSKVSLKRLVRDAGFDHVQFLPALASGTYGSMARIPASQLLKHGMYRLADVLTDGRLYLYSEVICVAR